MTNKGDTDIKFQSTFTDWNAITRGEKVDFDLDSSPLYLKTDSVLGDGVEAKVGFYTAEGHKVGGFLIRFSSPPKFAIWQCTDWTDLLTAIPSETEKVWRVTLTRTAGIRIFVHCNNVEVLNMLISDSTCAHTGWHTNWGNEVKKIEFPTDDKAYDFYQSKPTTTSGTYSFCSTSRLL